MIGQSRPDLVFLDVRMPGLTRFEVLQALPKDAPLPLVARRRDRFALLRLNQICFFEVENGIVRAKTEDDSYWTDNQINDLIMNDREASEIQVSERQSKRLRQMLQT
jgi:DNA-binding LytR/AlgR family response regulator